MKKILSTLAYGLASALAVTACSHTSNHTPATAVTISPFGEARQENIERKIDILLEQLTLDEKISLVHANGKFSVAAVERLGIHETWLSDGPHGVREEISRHAWDAAGWEDDQSTYLPPLTTVAASWNTDMAALHGDVLGAEARQRNKDFILGPGVNLARLPLYGRNFEYFGEDPYLAGQLAVAEIKAIQANDVAATVKHYALNTQELNRYAVDNNPDERTLREIYLPAFEMAVKEGGVLGVMGGYNAYKGENVNQSAELIQTILKDEWGFLGLVMTDWNVDINTFDAAMNGLDLEMGTAVDSYDAYFFAEPLKVMIEQGKVPLAVLDDKVRRLLRVHHLIGKMDKQRLSGLRNTTAHQQAALQIAQEGIVLLKNDPVQGGKVLPLDSTKLRNVLVLGPNADRVHAAGGGSTTIKALYEITPLQGIKQALGDHVSVNYLRVRSDAEIHPIDDAFVSTRHWTGIPVWYAHFFTDASRQTTLRKDSLITSELVLEQQQQTHADFFAELTPLTSGNHTFKVRGSGNIRVVLNGKNIIDIQDHDGILEVPALLVAGERYKVNIFYDGATGFTLGWDTPDDFFTAEAKALAAVKNTDAVIYIGGLSHGEDREGYDRSDMALPGEQNALLKKILATQDKTVVVMMAGSAVEMPWLDSVNALLWMGYGGAEGGNALADVLLGDVNPSAKMPYTLPKRLEDTPAIALDDYNPDNAKYPEGVFMGYRWFDQQAIEPYFAFGHGLSYTTFQYSDLHLSTLRSDLKTPLTATLTVTNTGKRRGGEVVQLYVADVKASVPRPLKELKHFEKVFLNPGESTTITFTLKERDFAFWNTEKSAWYVEPGEFDILMGQSSSNILLQQRMTVLH